MYTNACCSDYYQLKCKCGICELADDILKFPFTLTITGESTYRKSDLSSNSGMWIGSIVVQCMWIGSTIYHHGQYFLHRSRYVA